MIQVIVKTQKHKEGVQKNDQGYIVWTRKAPEKGRANDDVLKQMAKELHVSPSSLVIVRGRKSSIKYIKRSP